MLQGGVVWGDEDEDENEDEWKCIGNRYFVLTTYNLPYTWITRYKIQDIRYKLAYC